MRKAASYLFPALVAVSLALHFWAMQHRVPELKPLAATAEAVSITEIVMVEETPEPVSMPEPTPEPKPEPTPEPTPESEEKILTADESDIPAPAAPDPTPTPTPRATPTPKPKPTAKPSTPRASSASNIPVPVVIKNTPPTYPEIARRKGWEGRTIVRVDVSPDGRATKVSIARSSGYGVLDQAALRAVKQWRFQPRTIAGVPSAGTVEVPVNFGLNR